MKLSDSFGLVIAYLIPGFLVLWAAEPVYPAFGGQMASSEAAPTVGGFLYVTLASLALGLLLSAIRWLCVDPIHHRTGVTRPSWRFASMQEEHTRAAFEAAVESHYRYYQFYANGLVALVLVGLLHGASGWVSASAIAWIGGVLATIALFFGSRDALSKYYRRTAEILGEKSE